MSMLSQPYSKLPDTAQKAAYIYLKHIWNKIHKLQYNYAEVTTGNPGSGKTKSKITTAYLINRKRFDERFYCNTAKEFIQTVDDSRTGDTLVWDECGVSLSSRRWHSLSNILTGETLQTYRLNKLAVFFVVPDISFIDIQARKLMNAFVETKRYDLKKTTNWTYEIRVNRKTGDIYFPYFRSVIDGRLNAIPRIIYPKATINIVPKEITKSITEKEIEFKHRLRKRNLKLLEMIEGKAMDAGQTIFDMINIVNDDKEKYTNRKGNLDFYLIQTEFNIGKDKAIQIKKFIEKKGDSLSQKT